MSFARERTELATLAKQTSADALAEQTKFARVQQELEHVQGELSQKTDALRVKEKMLDDQLDTIARLKGTIKEKVAFIVCVRVDAMHISYMC